VLIFSVLITGPSKSGVGAHTAISLAVGKPKLIILAGRDQSKIQPVIDQIAKSSPDVPVTFVRLDLASQASVRDAAKQIHSQIESLDLLINNAGSRYIYEDFSMGSDSWIQLWLPRTIQPRRRALSCSLE
jgi:NADP-dependent 3-hydroxy acid dehydrogenase YdfG